MNVWPLDIHDLAASKLMAGRDKDFEFLQFLFIMDCAIFPPAWPDGVVANQPLRPCRAGAFEATAAEELGIEACAPLSKKIHRQPSIFEPDEKYAYQQGFTPLTGQRQSFLPGKFQLSPRT